MPSPIFLHERDCERFDRSNEVPTVLRIGLRSYDHNHDLIDGDVVAGTDLDTLIDRLFHDERAVYLHVHSATA